MLRPARPPVRQDRGGRRLRALVTLRNCMHAEAGGLLRGAGAARARRHHLGAAARRRAAGAPASPTARCALTNEQNLVVPLRARGEPDARCTPSSSRSGSAAPGARTIHDVTSCPGADTCNLAVTRSRELTTAVAERARRRRRARPPRRASASARHQDLRLPELVRAAPRRRARLPRHHAARRRRGGAGVSAPPRRRHRRASGATFGRQIVKLPARRVPDGGGAAARALSAGAQPRAKRRWPTSGASTPEVVKRGGRRSGGVRRGDGASPRSGSTTATRRRSRSRSARVSARAELRVSGPRSLRARLRRCAFAGHPTGDDSGRDHPGAHAAGMGGAGARVSVAAARGRAGGAAVAGQRARRAAVDELARRAGQAPVRREEAAPADRRCRKGARTPSGSPRRWGR